MFGEHLFMLAVYLPMRQLIVYPYIPFLVLKGKFEQFYRRCRVFKNDIGIFFICAFITIVREWCS